MRRGHFRGLYLCAVVLVVIGLSFLEAKVISMHPLNQRGSVGFHWVPRRIVGGFHNWVKGEGRVRIEVPWLVGRWNIL